MWSSRKGRLFLVVRGVNEIFIIFVIIVNGLILMTLLFGVWEVFKTVLLLILIAFMRAISKI